MINKKSRKITYNGIIVKKNIIDTITFRELELSKVPPCYYESYTNKSSINKFKVLHKPIYIQYMNDYLNQSKVILYYHVFNYDLERPAEVHLVSNENNDIPEVQKVKYYDFLSKPISQVNRFNQVTKSEFISMVKRLKIKKALLTNKNN